MSPTRSQRMSISCPCWLVAELLLINRCSKMLPNNTQPARNRRVSQCILFPTWRTIGRLSPRHGSPHASSLARVTRISCSSWNSMSSTGTAPSAGTDVYLRSSTSPLLHLDGPIHLVSKLNHVLIRCLKAFQDQEPRDRTDHRFAWLGHRLGRLLLDRASAIFAARVDPPDPCGFARRLCHRPRGDRDRQLYPPLPGDARGTPARPRGAAAALSRD